MQFSRMFEKYIIRCQKQKNITLNAHFTISLSVETKTFS